MAILPLSITGILGSIDFTRRCVQVAAHGLLRTETLVMSVLVAFLTLSSLLVTWPSLLIFARRWCEKNLLLFSAPDCLCSVWLCFFCFVAALIIHVYIGTSILCIGRLC